MDPALTLTDPSCAIQIPEDGSVTGAWPDVGGLPAAAGAGAARLPDGAGSLDVAGFPGEAVLAAELDRLLHAPADPAERQVAAAELEQRAAWYDLDLDVTPLLDAPGPE